MHQSRSNWTRKCIPCNNRFLPNFNLIGRRPGEWQPKYLFFTYHSVDGHAHGTWPSIIVLWYVITGSTLLCVSRTLAGRAWNKCNIRLLSIMTGVNRSLQRRRSVDSLQFSSIFFRRQTQTALLCWPTHHRFEASSCKQFLVCERIDISWQIWCRML